MMHCAKHRRDTYRMAKRVAGRGARVKRRAGGDTREISDNIRYNPVLYLLTSLAPVANFPALFIFFLALAKHVQVFTGTIRHRHLVLCWHVASPASICQSSGALSE